jgi:hypothetical protein
MDVLAVVGITFAVIIMIAVISTLRKLEKPELILRYKDFFARLGETGDQKKE